MPPPAPARLLPSSGAVGRIRQQQRRLGPAQEEAHVLGGGAVPAHEPVAPQLPDLPPAHPGRLLSLLRHVVGVRLRLLLALLSAGGLQGERRQLKSPHAHVQLIDGVQLHPEPVQVKAGLERQLIVHQGIGPALLLAEPPEHDHRHALQPQQLRRGQPAVALDHQPRLVRGDGVVKSQLPDAPGNGLHLLPGVQLGVARIRPQSLPRPVLDAQSLAHVVSSSFVHLSVGPGVAGPRSSNLLSSARRRR